MNSIAQFAQAAAKIRGELDSQFPEGFLYVTSLDNFAKLSTPGTVSQVTTDSAARLIVDGTHKVSTPDEIAGFEAHMKAEGEKYAQAELRKVRQDMRVHVEVGGQSAEAKPIPFPLNDRKK